MSIDHGKVLVACRRKLEAYRDAYGLEYVGGQELSSLLSDIDRALAQPAEAVDTGALTNLLRMLRDRESAALYGWPRWFDMCADELDSFLISTGSVQDSSAPQRFESEATTGPHSQTAAISGNCTGPTHDAAQGAVALLSDPRNSRPVAWEHQCSGGRNVLSYVKNDARIENVQRVRPLAYTHPQAAPAQGDGEEDRCGWCGRARSSDPLSHDPHCRVRTHPHSDWAKRELSRGATPSPEPR